MRDSNYRCSTPEYAREGLLSQSSNVGDSASNGIIGKTSGNSSLCSHPTQKTNVSQQELAELLRSVYSFLNHIETEAIKLSSVDRLNGHWALKQQHVLTKTLKCYSSSAKAKVSKIAKQLGLPEKKRVPATPLKKSTTHQAHNHSLYMGLSENSQLKQYQSPHAHNANHRRKDNVSH